MARMTPHKAPPGGHPSARCPRSLSHNLKGDWIEYLMTFFVIRPHATLCDLHAAGSHDASAVANQGIHFTAAP